MSANIPLKNDLQKEFAERAHNESIKLFKMIYIQPWKRTRLMKASTLDPIYVYLEKFNFDKSADFTNLRTKIKSLPTATEKKYHNTLRWLSDKVLDGDYVQKGNSCGAWSLTHWQMRKAKHYYGAPEFRTKAQSNYTGVKFLTTDGSSPLLTIWTSPPGASSLNPAYTNPWKIAGKMPGSKLKILKAARTFASNNSTPLEKSFNTMLKAIEALGTKIPDGELSTLPTGSCAIITLYQTPTTAGAPPLLHYMLVAHTKTGWEIFNSNSSKLNTPIVTSCPKFQDSITHNIMSANGSVGKTETWQFLGLFIS